MKIISEFLKVVKKDVKERGTFNNNSDYIIKLDNFDRISSIKFAALPEEKINESTVSGPIEKQLVQKWLDFKIRTMREWEKLYNESIEAYNDHCAVRAGESDAMFNLVIKGYEIDNVKDFDYEKRKRIRKA